MKTIDVDYLNNSPDLLSVLSTEKLVFIQSPTGSGKTTFISKINLGSTLYISVNRTNCMQLQVSLNNPSIKSYIPTGPQKTSHSYMAHSEKFFRELKKGESYIINALSLHRIPDDFVWDAVIIDEIGSLLSSIVEPISSINSINHILAIEALKRILVSAKKILCLDGFISKDTIKCFSKLAESKHVFVKNTKPVKKKAVIVNVNSTGLGKFFKPKTATTKYFLDRFNYSCKKSSKFLVSCTTKRIIDDFYAHIINNYSDLLLDGKAISLTPENIKFYEDRGLSINELTKNPILLLYSPVVVTALDIKNFENEEVFHIINSNHMSSVANYQMVNRPRNVKQSVIFVPTSSYKKSGVTPNKDHFKKLLFSYLKYNIKNIHNIINRDYKKFTLDKKYYNKLFVFSLNYVKYLSFLGEDHLQKFLSEMENNKIYFPEGKHFLVDLAFYHYKSFALDLCNGTANNFIDLLKQEGYEIEVRDETISEQDRVREYRDALTFKIENHFKYKVEENSTVELFNIIKLCQYLVISKKYRVLDGESDDFDLVREYNKLITMGIPEKLNMALQSNKGYLTLERHIIKRMRKIYEILFVNEKISRKLIISTNFLTPTQRNLYENI